MVKETGFPAKIDAEKGIYRERKLYTFLNGFGQGKISRMPNIKNIIIN